MCFVQNRFYFTRKPLGYLLILIDSGASVMGTGGCHE